MIPTASMQTDGKAIPRFTAIEGARALLAWWVVLAHVIDFSGFDAKDLPAAVMPLRQGILPVYVFMMISGFVITHLLLTRAEPYGTYIVRRYFRLFPLHAFVLAVVLLLVLLGLPVTRVGTDVVYERFLLELSMLNGAVPRSMDPASWGSLNTPNWSISVEMQFYLIAPLLIIPLVSRSRWRWAAGGVALALIIAAGLSYGRWLCFFPGVSCTQFPHPSFLPIVANYFAIGVGTYLLCFRRETLGGSVLGWLLVLLPFALIESVVIPAVIWAGLVAILLSPGSVVSRLLSSTPLFKLGSVSYSTYMIHFPIVYYAGNLARQQGFGGTDMETLAFVAAVSIPPVLLLSFLVYRFVEVPGIRLGATLARKLDQREKTKNAA
ncbi:acyltransferase family protein [Arenimonas aestuarii]